MVDSFRAGDYAIVVDGQSITTWPSPAAVTPADYHANSWPMKLKNLQRRRCALWNGGIPGYSWTQLDNDFASRIGPYLNMANKVFFLMNGGTTQIQLGQLANTIYNTEKAVADMARAINPNVIVITATTTPSTSFDGTATIPPRTAPDPTTSQNIQLAALNAQKIADPLNAFDAVVQLAEDSRLANPYNSTYYIDGTHPTSTTNGGTKVHADLYGAAIDTFL